MGYRLEFKNPNQPDEWVQDCGGELYGYVDVDFEKLKSWNWMKENGFFLRKTYTWKEDGKNAPILTQVTEDDEYQYIWTYGYEHKMFLSHDKFKEFIELYIDDWNTYRKQPGDEYEMTIDEFAFTLSLDVVECSWW